MVLFTFKVFGQTDFLTKAKSYYNVDSNIIYGEKHLQQCIASTYNSKGIINAYRYVVSNYFNKGKYTHAKKMIQDMLFLSYRKHDKEMEYVGIGLLGDFEKYSTNYSKAVNFYLIAYNGLEKGRYWENLCRSTIDLIELNRAIAKYNDAELYIKQAFKLFKEHQLNDPTILVRLYSRTAAVKNETRTLELIDSSIVYSKLALKINQQLKNKNDEAITWNELGYSYRHLKNIDTAEYCFNIAEKIWFESGIDISAINAISNRAALYAFYKVKQQEVIPLYLKIIETVKNKNLNYDLDNVYK